jgi:hypothetical protein
VGRLPEATAAADEAERRLQAHGYTVNGFLAVRDARRAIERAKKKAGANPGDGGPKP